jgi:Flp pilus assembly protein TadD
MKGGAADFVQKPFTPDELRRTVARALGRLPDEQRGYARVIGEARAAARRGHLDVADSLARAAFALDPERAEAPCLLGALLEMRGKRDRAQDLYRAAVALDATFAPARTNLDRSVGHEHDRPPLLGDEE